MLGNKQGKNFAITGVAGYVAPRHLDAIRRIGGNLLAAVDPHDSVGIIDNFFPQAAFFSEYERFDRFLEKSKRLERDQRVDWVSICSPNYLHDAHIRTALRVGADAICEKPLVIDPKNLDALALLEDETGSRVWTILQLRVHPLLRELKDKLAKANFSKRCVVELTYIAPRGKWYQYSWKGDKQKSGGICANIGIHFFDLLAWFFGSPEHITVNVAQDDLSVGILENEKAQIKWFLSTDAKWLPQKANASEKTAGSFRSITIDDEEVEFSGGFADLHFEVYKETLAGRGFSIDDSRAAVEIVDQIRKAPISGLDDRRHRLLSI